MSGPGFIGPGLSMMQLTGPYMTGGFFPSLAARPFAMRPASATPMAVPPGAMPRPYSASMYGSPAYQSMYSSSANRSNQYQSGQYATDRSYGKQRSERTLKTRKPQDPVDALIQQLDNDGDGRISSKEARGLFLELFDVLDLNHDGYLDREEIAAALKNYPGLRGPNSGVAALDRPAPARTSEGTTLRSP